jgi:hypothetical protein
MSETKYEMNITQVLKALVNITVSGSSNETYANMDLEHKCVELTKTQAVNCSDVVSYSYEAEQTIKTLVNSAIKADSHEEFVESELRMAIVTSLDNELESRDEFIGNANKFTKPQNPDHFYTLLDLLEVFVCTNDLYSSACTNFSNKKDAIISSEDIMLELSGANNNEEVY